MVLPVRRGRPPKTAPEDRSVRVPWSMPVRVIEAVKEIADERGVPYSEVAREFIERGLVEQEIQQRMKLVAS